MTREQKISLIVGFALVLLVAVAISDHLSSVRSANLETSIADAGDWAGPIAALPEPVAAAALPAEPEPAPTGNEPAGPIEGGGTPPPAPTILDRLRERFTGLTLAGEVDTLPAPAVAATSEPKREPAPATVVWHSVREGESLWAIAQEHYGDGALAARLAAFNADRVPDPDTLRAGVRLRIPPRSALEGSPRPRTTPAPRSGSAPADAPQRTYTIKPGDTLGEIAQRELGTVRRLGEILALNPGVLTDPDVAPVGVVIRLPDR
ncbi:MAG: LysM peptidoglycan-binding domain-containing protein [Planctomycetota bacterium]|nr:MAG: LysM peptidoglycan-binding domain-containing protein [Planctomycetota bacterium]